MAAEHDVEETWQEFWLPILNDAEGDPHAVLYDEDDTPGYLSVAMLDQIKRELHDYRTWMKTWSEVACELSGGKLSKINYTPDVYLSAFEEEIESQLKERVQEEVEDLQITADENAWQAGYNKGHGDGRDQGIEEGLEQARRAIW